MRPETGLMQFGDDWRGVFVRGDNAAEYAMALRRVLEHPYPPEDPSVIGCLEALAELFEHADEHVEAPVQEAKLAASRPWHYVTEKLPEPRQRVEFWRTFGDERTLRGRVRQTATFTPTDEGGGWFGGWAPTTKTLWSGERGTVYAWQPEPEPPPLPEVLPTADEVYGIMSPAHPVSGGPGFNEDGKEAPGPPVDPDLLQAQDAARMERKR